MSKSIIKSLQEKYGENFHKIDANDPSQAQTIRPETTNYLKQACVSSLLAGIGDYTSDPGIPVLPNASNEDSLNVIFKNHLPQIKTAIARYAHDSEEKVERYLLKTYGRVQETINEIIGDDPKAIQTAFHAQSDEILSYLPSSLGISEILDHSGIDDRTHKMNGLLSSFTKFLGKFLDPDSTGDNKAS